MKKLVFSLGLSIITGVLSISVNAMEIGNSKYVIYCNEITNGKSKEYAEYYANLIVNEKLNEKYARVQAGIYCYHIVNNKDRVSASHLATLEIRKMMDKDLSNIYWEEVLANKKSKSYAYCYARLRIERGLSSERASKQAHIYDKEIGKGKSVEYAECYADLIAGQGMRKDLAKIYCKEIEYGRDKEYASYYIKLLSEGIEENEARAKADIYDLETKYGNYSIYVYNLAKIDSERLSGKRDEPVTKKRRVNP